MPTVIVNNQPVEFAPGERLNCIEAAERIGCEVPHYCWHPGLSVVASCRMCLVEVGEKKPDGTIAMMPKLVPGCQTPVKDGMIVVADSEKVKVARKATLEYLLLNHPLDCPTCDQAGECYLQDYSFKYGRGYSRLQEPKNIKPDKDYIGDQITLFTDRCIMCSQCVRFTREVSGSAELQIINRGTHAEIDIFPGKPCNNPLAGNVVDLCPVGALCSKDFLYKQRVWWLKSADSVCPQCSTGCSITVDQNEDQIYRVTPRTNVKSQGWFMCDEGRFGWKGMHTDARLLFPEQRDGDRVVSRDWDVVLPEVRKALSMAARDTSKRIAAVLSPWMTVEEAYLLASHIKDLSPQATLALGPVRVVGNDETFPKDQRGRPLEPVKFTIRAEKCPNRLGVEAVLKHFAGNVVSFGDFLGHANAGELSAAYVVGGDPFGWIEEGQAAALDRIDTLVVQDIFATPASQRAKFVLPGGAYTERDGAFVNYKGLAQEIHRSVRTPGEARPDGRILWDLGGRRGLFHAANVRKEIGQTIPDFKCFGDGKLGESGRLLSEDPPAAVASGNGAAVAGARH